LLKHAQHPPIPLLNPIALWRGVGIGFVRILLNWIWAEELEVDIMTSQKSKFNQSSCYKKCKKNLKLK
jgi:hypothetical protein